MNSSESDFRVTCDRERAYVTSRYYVVRGVAGLIFVLIGAGIVTAHRMRAAADAPTVSAPQPQQAVNSADTASPDSPSQHLNQATAVEPRVEAF